MRVLQINILILFFFSQCLTVCYSAQKSGTNINVEKISTKSKKSQSEVLKKEIFKSNILKKVPTYYFLENNKHQIITDVSFLPFFENNYNSFRVSKNININVSDEISLCGMAEYNILPQVLYRQNKKKIYNCGLYNLNNVKCLFIKYYDINSSRFYMLTIDKNYKLLSCICIYGYSTINSKDTFKISDKKVGKPFVKFKKQSQNINVSVYGGNSNCFYTFYIKKSGFLELLKYNVVDN